ncbi:MAG TPA: SRPBCC domain-containing protein [Amycolatopsis sp.]|nr:SRPBCC domain-containing protein [Amycolatopsis sp.]
MNIPDEIEQEIDIDAPVDVVWELVTVPGWWVGDAAGTAPRPSRDGDLYVVDDPRYGRFPVLVESAEPRKHVAYRWASAFPGQAPGDGTATLVEFWLGERSGGARVRVVESGFGALRVPEAARAQAVADNVDGWREQLGALRTRAEHGDS